MLMNFTLTLGLFSIYLLILVFIGGSLFLYTAPNSVTAVTTDPYQISDDLVKDTYLVFIKQKMNQGLGTSSSDCDPGIGGLQTEDGICNPGLENMNNKLSDEDVEIIKQLSKNIEKKETILQDRFEKLTNRMEKAISEEEEQESIPLEEQKKVDTDDIKSTEQHKSLVSENCRDGDVLDGASNVGDLKVLAECQDAIGDVMHTKKMDDGDYKFLLKLEDKYEFLLNDKNQEKTDGLLVVEVVPKDQNIENLVLPQAGDKVHVWGAWVTDEPKGWHEIHPTWLVTNE
jgi:hypothetical protein